MPQMIALTSTEKASSRYPRRVKWLLLDCNERGSTSRTLPASLPLSGAGLGSGLRASRWSFRLRRPVLVAVVQIPVRALNTKRRALPALAAVVGPA
ncbi:hypothetical protein [Gluconobacter oxydans]|uniref:hypothetical protein n=1 Tax=Gluconobacter oxydans TaxID=442 RepID=UPI00128DD88D|nr:hypothetical protein [Gluconobacter oxydans]